MKINEELLKQFRDIRSLRQIGERFERGDLIGAAKELKAELWEAVHALYSLPTGMKFSVELDGDLAGELRVKGTGQAYVPEKRSFVVAVWKAADGSLQSAAGYSRSEFIAGNNNVVLTGEI